MGYYGRRRQKRTTYIAAKTNQANDILTVASQAQDKLTVYVQALLELFSRSNSILAGQTVKCTTSDATPIACTDGVNVYFNPDLLAKALGGLDKGKLNVSNAIQSLAHIRGVNLHELAHIKFSPRKGQLPWNEVDRLAKELAADPNLAHLAYAIPVHRAWNLLEDLRIESLFSAQYRNTIPYFNRTITEIILNDPNARVELTHLWLYGRRYVPADIRQQARDLFIKETNISDADLNAWEGLIDDYRSFIFPRDGRKIAPLLLRFLELWNKYFPNESLPETGTGPDGAGGHGERRQGGTPSADEQRNAQSRREEVEDEWEQQDEEGDDNGSQTGGESDSDGDADEDTDSDQSDDSDGDNPDGIGGGDADDSDEDAEQGNGLSGDQHGSSNNPNNDKSDDADSNGNKGGGVSRGDGNSSQASDNSASSKLLKNLEDSLAESTGLIHDDIADTLKQVIHRAERLKVDALFRNIEQPNSMLPPSPKFKAVSNALNTALRQLRSDNDSMWERGVPTGRLNIGLAINAEAQDSDDDVFERWNDSGDDAPKVEVVILLDQSGSMSSSVPTEQSTGYYSTIAEASAAMWALKLACQQNDVPCTVIGYADASQTAILYRADDRVTQQVGIYKAKDCTDPSVALKIAHAIFSQSDATNKILVSISDGEWSVGTEDIRTIRAINSLDVDTLFVALPSQYGMEYLTDGQGNVLRDDKGDPRVRYTPRFAVGLERGIHMGYRKDGTPIYSACNYEHRVCLKVANPAELAKRIGRAIVSASR